MMRRMLGLGLGLGFMALAACGEVEPRVAIKDYVGQQLGELAAATRQLRQVAPEPRDDGWHAERDAAALASSRQAWRDARLAYERVEGAIAQIFTDLDHDVDGRYDDFPSQRRLEMPTPNLFNGEAATGMHAVERILWSAAVAPPVVAAEQTMANYQAARYPACLAEARDYRDVLVARLVRDVQTMQGEFQDIVLDLAAAYDGVVNSMREQREKVNVAGSGLDESRYASHTLADMRANLEGGRVMYRIFAPTVRRAPGGDALDRSIEEHFSLLEAAYAAFPGDSLPDVPVGWSAAPAPQLLASDYGRLWELVRRESDARGPDSLVYLMLQARDLLAFEAAP